MKKKTIISVGDIIVSLLIYLLKCFSDLLYLGYW